MHVLWGKRPEDSSQSDASSSRKAQRRQASHRSHTDSSETPRLVGEPTDSSQSSSFQDKASGRGTQPNSDHILYGDDSSDISDARQGGQGAPGASGETPSASAAQPPFPSTGSQLHSSGRCRPCMFSHTVIGCANGASCDFCHLSHHRRRAARPCKAKRERFKAIADRQAREAGLLGSDAEGGAAEGLEAVADEQEEAAESAASEKNGTEKKNILCL